MAKRNSLNRANNKRSNSETSRRKNTVSENTDKWNRLFSLNPPFTMLSMEVIREAVMMSEDWNKNYNTFHLILNACKGNI